MGIPKRTMAAGTISTMVPAVRHSKTFPVILARPPAEKTTVNKRRLRSLFPKTWPELLLDLEALGLGRSVQIFLTTIPKQSILQIQCVNNWIFPITAEAEGI